LRASSFQASDELQVWRKTLPWANYQRGQAQKLIQIEPVVKRGILAGNAIRSEQECQPHRGVALFAQAGKGFRAQVGAMAAARDFFLKPAYGNPFNYPRQLAGNISRCQLAKREAVFKGKRQGSFNCIECVVVPIDR